MKECPDCKTKGKVEFIDNILLGTHGACTLYECKTCGQMYVYNSEDEVIQDA